MDAICVSPTGFFHLAYTLPVHPCCCRRLRFSFRNTPRHIIIKLPKIKVEERVLKAAREKKRVIYKGVPIRLSVDFSKETSLGRRGWKEVFES